MFCTEKLSSAPVVNNIFELDSFLYGFEHCTNLPFDKYLAFTFFTGNETSSFENFSSGLLVGLSIGCK